MTCSKVIGWVLLVLGKIGTVFLLILLVLLLFASVCVVVTGLPDVGWGIAWSIVGTLFALVLSRLAVGYGRRLAHPLEERHATPQPLDVPGDEEQ